MTPDQLRELVRLDEQMWNAHDSVHLAALVAPDVEFHTPSASEPVWGRDAFRKIAERYLSGLPDFRIKNRPIAFTEDTVVVGWRVTGTHDGPLVVELRVTGTNALVIELAATGRRVDVQGCSVLRVNAAGLIATVDEFWNQAAIVPQLGIRPFIVGAIRAASSRLGR